MQLVFFIRILYLRTPITRTKMWFLLLNEVWSYNEMIEQELKVC